jgi:hypothetical protein
MVTATILALEEPTPEWAKARTRRELHDNFDLWLDSLEESVREVPPSLEVLTRAVLVRRQELTAQVTEALVRQRHSQALEEKNAPCPRCGRLLPTRGLVSRTVETLVGEVAVERPYFYCLKCRQGFYPLDEALELSERRKQWDIQESGVRLAAEVPFETAQELFSELTGLSLSDHTTHEMVGEVAWGLGVLEVSPTAEEIAQRVSQVAEGNGPSEPAGLGGHRGELGLLAPGGPAAREDIGRPIVLTIWPHRTICPDQCGVPVDGNGVTEPVTLQRVARGEFGLLAPDVTPPLKNVNRPRLATWIGRTSVIVKWSPHKCGVPAEGHRITEQIPRRGVHSGEFGLLAPGVTAPHKDIGRPRLAMPIVNTCVVIKRCCHQRYVPANCDRNAKVLTLRSIIGCELGLLAPGGSVVHKDVGRP